MSRKYFVNMGPVGFATSANAWVKIWRGITQISITVNPIQVEGTHFGRILLRQIESCKGCPFGEHRGHTDPVHLIYLHCLPTVERLAPQTSIEDLCLENLLHSPAYHLELVDAGQNQDFRIVGDDRCVRMPLFSASPVRNEELLGSYKPIARFQASRIWIAPNSDPTSSLDTLQGRVVMPEGTSMYFKPRLEGREREFERELRVMSRIEEIGLRAQIRVPELYGIVVSGQDGGTVVGIVMSLIALSKIGTTLESPGFWSQLEFHKKWEDQVYAMVRELHAHDLVWGDVNPTNIMIDEGMDAWIIDFGGMNNVEFVDEENRETIKGDWQGVRRLFQEWLPIQAGLEKKTARNGND
jgi:hypothetical protein